MTSWQNTGTHPFFMPSQHNAGTHPFFKTSQRNTGTHSFLWQASIRPILIHFYDKLAKDRHSSIFFDKPAKYRYSSIFLTSWHKTGAHPFYIGMYIQTYTHMYMYINILFRRNVYIFFLWFPFFFHTSCEAPPDFQWKRHSRLWNSEWWMNFPLKKDIFDDFPLKC